MEKLIGLCCLVSYLMFVTGTESSEDTQPQVNSSDVNKDMYVIHAMLYQVGVVSNKTDNDTADSNLTGNQETLTLYHHNGSEINLSQIPAPLLTNVTAQSVLGVAPVTHSGNDSEPSPWNALKDLSNMTLNSEQGSNQAPISMRTVRATDTNTPFKNETPRTMDNIYRSFFKRDTLKDKPTYAITEGSTVIPPTAGVQSIAIPPLLTFNNNLSHIPVPIPNTSVVQYSKINTLLTPP